MYLFLGIIGSIIGLIVSFYIRSKKNKKQKLVCPRSGSCDKVVHSSHSKTFGIPNELLGITYYLGLAILYSAILIYPPIMNTFVSWLITVMTICGILFSLYLIALQAFVIGEWCMWCLGSTGATLILLIALLGLGRHTDFLTMVANQSQGWLMLHILGLIIGVGASTVADILFLRFLKDGIISIREKKIINKFVSVVWLGLGFLILSGLMLYLPHREFLNVSVVFRLKMLVVGGLVVIGVLLNMFVAPKMRRFSFENTKPAKSFRRFAFALGGLSLVSWYSALGLGLLSEIDLAFRESATLYLAILITTVIATNTYESIISQTRTNRWS